MTIETYTATLKHDKGTVKNKSCNPQRRARSEEADNFRRGMP